MGIVLGFVGAIAFVVIVVAVIAFLMDQPKI